jgi:hypothetical protein
MPVDGIQGGTGLQGGGTSGTITVNLATPINPVNISATNAGVVNNVLTITAVGTASWQPPAGGGIPGVTVSGTPAAGQLLTATSASAANWQNAPPTGITALTGDVTASAVGSAAATVARLQNGIVLSGTPSANQVLKAQSATAASWQNEAVGGITALTGDVTASGSGSQVATVGRLQGAVSLSGVPGNGQVLTASSATAASWQTPAVAGITALTGDVTATGSGSVTATVAQIRGVAVASTAPQANQVLTAINGTTASWQNPASAGLPPLVYEAIAAAGVDQSTATACNATTSFSDVTSGTGGVKWTPTVNQAKYIRNGTNAPINIYPGATGGSINSLAANASIALPPDNVAMLIGWTTTPEWLVTVP